MSQEELTYCEVHPDRETGLRCNKCGRLMCAECAVQTPIGYRCRECVRQVEDKFFDGTQTDYIVIFAVSTVLGIVAGAIVSIISWVILALILGFPVGGAISEAALRAVKKRKNRQTGRVLAAGTVIGGFIGAAIRLSFEYQDTWGEVVRQFEQARVQLPPQVPTMTDFITGGLTDIGLLAFIAIAAFAAYSRVKM